MKRNSYLDYLKGMSMMLVTYGHCNIPGGGVIGLFHMPLFFFISGYLFHEYELKSFVKKKICSLYVPFVLYEIFFLCCRNIFFKIHFYCKEDWTWMHSVKSGRELGGLLLHIFLFDNIDELLAPMWFCTALFFASLIYYCIHRINLDKIINIIILLVLLIVAFLIKRKNFIICYSINFKSIISTVLAATFFYGIGNVCRDTKLMEKLLENNRSRLIYGMVMGGILGITYFDGVRGGMLDLSYNNPILFLIASLSGLILFWTLVFQLYKLNF